MTWAADKFKALSALGRCGSFLTDGEFRVLLSLFGRTSKDDATACPSLATLAKDVGIHRRSLRRILAHLKAKGMLRALPGVHTSTNRKPVEYDLTPMLSLIGMTFEEKVGEKPKSQPAPLPEDLRQHVEAAERELADRKAQRDEKLALDEAEDKARYAKKKAFEEANRRAEAEQAKKMLEEKIEAAAIHATTAAPLPKYRH